MNTQSAQRNSMKKNHLRLGLSIHVHIHTHNYPNTRQGVGKYNPGAPYALVAYVAGIRHRDFAAPRLKACRCTTNAQRPVGVAAYMRVSVAASRRRADAAVRASNLGAIKFCNNRVHLVQGLILVDFGLRSGVGGSHGL
ncbi:hypothetical protein SASPL_127333 [Salvia splendens]|uniref:Uncharacterized protein n=1 Tax=Salvia splendens TaxID=180675 RepID=A0A8X8X918_SALSN|nr:hypothetical protein SASPL_127333 [Salvia splendens]